jgi:hypothetical protein
VSRARWSGPGSWSLVGGLVVGGGPAPFPVWGEAVRCLGIHPLRTRQGAGGVHGALRPQRQLGSITYLDPHTDVGSCR